MRKRLTLLLVTTIMLLNLRASNYTIYPIPHQISMGNSKMYITQTVNIQSDASIDQATINRAIEVLINAGYIVTTNEAVNDVTQLILCTSTSAGSIAKNKFDRHILVIDDKNITITGEHTNAVFCGLASLEQILEQRNADGTFNTTTIHDYADQKNRGLVEGYYGYPYSVSVKKDLMHFMMRYKMNTYMYGAKSDPYHSQYWQDAYPTTITAQQEKNGWLSQDMVKELAATSTETKVNFIWAIHPGNNFVGSSTVISDIMSKFSKMHDLGVRQFAVFVDDVGIPSSDADMKTNADRLTALQRAIETKWNVEDAEPTDTVRPLHFVPQIYCSSFASSTDQRQRFMAALGQTPSYITIYTTGQGVWSVPNSSHMQNMNSELGRDMAWWWNYPCNDNADGQIYTMDMYSNFYDLPSVDGSATMPSNLTNTVGLVANPMQEGEVAKTALFSVADYAWNNSGFNNQKSWEASFQPLISDSTTRESYRFLTRYLRWNEPSSVMTLIENYKSTLTQGKPNSTSLRSLLDQIIDNCSQVETLETSKVESDQLLYQDLRPWLNKLKADCQTITKFLDVAENTDSKQLRWLDYLEGLNDVEDLANNTDYTAYALEGMGSSISVSQRQAQVSQLYLEPFISYIQGKAMTGCFEDQRPTAQSSYVTNQANLKPTVTSTDNMVTISASARLYNQGEFVGIKLPQSTKLDSIHVADSLFTNYPILWSSNGKQWSHLAQANVAPDSLVRYLIVINESNSPRPFRLYKKDIQLFLPTKTMIADITIPTDKEVWQSHTKDYIIDGDYNTFCTLNRCQQSGDQYTVDLGGVQTIHDVRICMGTTNGDYMTEGRVQVSEDGEKWFALRVKGVTDNFKYTLEMPQNVKYSEDMTYCDFDGRERDARYVRLSVTVPNTEKWLRLYEIEVNHTYDAQALRQLCADAEGNSLSNPIDGDGTTFLTVNQQSPISYYFEEMNEIQSVDIYSAVNDDAHVAVDVTNDGEQWQEVATLTETYQHIDLTDYPRALAIRLSWTDDEAPSIYEIVPTFANDTILPIVTGVIEMPVSASKGCNKIYNLQGQQMSYPTKRGLYIQNHQVRVMGR